MFECTYNVSLMFEITAMFSLNDGKFAKSSALILRFSSNLFI